MEYIDFGYGYRLHRRDSANWELQESRKPSNKGFAKNMEGKSPKRCDCGKFFQSLSAALTVVYGLVLRKGEEGAFQIMQALDRAVMVVLSTALAMWLSGAPDTVQCVGDGE